MTTVDGRRATVLGALRAGLPADVIVTDEASVDAYRHDQAQLCAAGMPLAVVRPLDTSQVQHVMRVADTFDVPVVPQGARSGLAGAANAVDGCVVVSTLRMDRITVVDPMDRIAVVQPGVVNAVLSREVATHGLYYPPDPSSWEISTIGGNLATNAGGLCCVKYGVTADFVRELEVVLVDGRVIRTGSRTAKGVAGYDLTRLLVGSEGTLGIITEATLALRPRSDAPLTIAAVFPDAASALRGAAQVIAAGIRPAILEFLDRVTIRAIQDMRDMGLPRNAGGLLLACSDRGAAAPADLAAMAALFRAAGAIDVAEASDAVESDMLMAARRMAAPAMERLGAVLFEDVAVPLAQLTTLVDGVAAIAHEHDTLIACCGHAGDGNLHPMIVMDRADDAARARAEAAFLEIMELGLALGGTITGEHGVGLLKRTALAQELGRDVLDLHRGIKAVFDPKCLLNPGKVLP